MFKSQVARRPRADTESGAMNDHEVLHLTMIMSGEKKLDVTGPHGMTSTMIDPVMIDTKSQRRHTTSLEAPRQIPPNTVVGETKIATTLHDAASVAMGIVAASDLELAHVLRLQKAAVRMIEWPVDTI
jgi:hypothetical protein